MIYNEKAKEKLNELGGLFEEAKDHHDEKLMKEVESQFREFSILQKLEASVGYTN